MSDVVVNCELASRFEGVRRLLWSTCYKIKGIYGLGAYGNTIDDLYGEACVAFMDADKSYDPEKGKYSYYIAKCVYRRLQSARTYEMRRYPIHGLSIQALPSSDTYEELGASYHENTYEGFRLDEYIEELSEDARIVCRLIFYAPQTLIETAQAKGGSASNWRTTVKDHLKQLQWSPDEIKGAFDEIRMSLGIPV